MNRLIISESKKTNYVSPASGFRYRTRMVVTVMPSSKKKTNGKPGKTSYTTFEPIIK